MPARRRTQRSGRLAAERAREARIAAYIVLGTLVLGAGAAAWVRVGDVAGRRDAREALAADADRGAGVVAALDETGSEAGLVQAVAEPLGGTGAATTRTGSRRAHEEPSGRAYLFQDLPERIVWDPGGVGYEELLRHPQVNPRGLPLDDVARSRLRVLVEEELHAVAAMDRKAKDLAVAGFNAAYREGRAAFQSRDDYVESHRGRPGYAYLQKSASEGRTVYFMDDIVEDGASMFKPNQDGIYKGYLLRSPAAAALFADRLRASLEVGIRIVRLFVDRGLLSGEEGTVLIDDLLHQVRRLIRKHSGR